MTKGELKKALAENLLPDDSTVLISLREQLGEEVTWSEIGFVDKTNSGVPILIGVGKTVME